MKLETKRDEKDTETIDWVEEETGDEYQKTKRNEGY